MSEASQDEDAGGRVRVPVHEDFSSTWTLREGSCRLFIGWVPIYEVRRGSWFYQEGSTLRPCDENLATQLEEDI